MKQAALKHGVQEKSREKTETAAAGRGRSPRLPETVEVDRNLPIQVAALCDTTGQIHPLWRMRITGYGRWRSAPYFPERPFIM